MWNKIDMYDNIRNILIILSSIATITILIIKSGYEILIEMVKSKFEAPINNKSYVNVIVQLVFWLLIAFDILYLSIFLYYIFIYKNITSINNSINFFTNNNIISLILILLFSIMIFFTYSYFKKMSLEYEERLKNSIEVEFPKNPSLKKYRKYSSLLIILASLFLLTFTIVIYNIIMETTITQLISIGFTWSNCIFILSLLLNLNSTYDKFNMNLIYTLITANDTISCKLYLNYGDHYMIYEDKKERYLPKSEVKEIIKNSEEIEENISQIENDQSLQSDRQIPQSNKQNKYELIVIIIIVLLFSFIFLLLLRYYHKPEYDNWYSILSSFVGSIIGGLATLIAVYITVKQTREIQDDIVKREEKNEYIRVSSGLFIAHNDLLHCFKDITEILIRFAICNSAISRSQEERAKYILEWKAIRRGYIYFKDWRNILKDISTTIDNDLLQYLYELYTVFEKSTYYNDSLKNNNLNYEDLFINIEYIPKELIFNESFLNKYNNLKIAISEYDYFIKNIYNKNNNNEEIQKEELNMSNSIYKQGEYFNNLLKEIEKDSYFLYMKKEEILNMKFKDILTTLETSIKS